MNNISIHQVITFALAIALFVFAFNLYQFKGAQKQEFTKLNQAIEFVAVNGYKNEASIDSLSAQNIQLAKTIMYVDSCQQTKTNKADRAERRGKFVGGLLKGLFPGL
jgi:hypothetical protein